MTNGEIYDKFRQAYKAQVNVNDYRPIAPLYTEDLKDKVGIVVWLDNGDTLLYFPKQDNTENNV